MSFNVIRENKIHAKISEFTSASACINQLILIYTTLQSNKGNHATELAENQKGYDI